LTVSSVTSLPLEPQLLEQLGDQLPAPLLEKVTETLRRLELENRYLRELLRLERIAKYGPASERLSDAQLELLELEPGVSSAEVEAESERDQLQLPLKQVRRTPVRQALPAHLPRIEQIIECTAEECVCGGCGGQKIVIGYEQSEQLDVEPAKYFVRVVKREKRACKRCEERGVTCAKTPARIIEKGLASDRVIIDAVVSKYCDHLPLYRQSAILERETGLQIPRATLCGWVMRVGELLRPIVASMAGELVAGDYIQADETPVGVQTHDGRGRNHRAYLWQYSRPVGPVIFEFQMNRSREGPRKFLKDFNGILQSDGYGGYDRVGGEKMIHAGCWAHARRYFFEALQVHRQDRVVAEIVLQIDRLFAIETEAKELGYSAQQRLGLRRERSAPLLVTVLEQIQAARQNALPKSALAKACDYVLTLWKRLTVFLEYAQIELSNNWAENAIRPVALGRKNWIHLGSDEAGPRVAAILSLIETCRRQQIPIRNYLSAVLPGLADFPANRVDELTPGAWAATR
jgi:transposase